MHDINTFTAVHRSNCVPNVYRCWLVPPVAPSAAGQERRRMVCLVECSPAAPRGGRYGPGKGSDGVLPAVPARLPVVKSPRLGQRQCYGGESGPVPPEIRGVTHAPVTDRCSGGVLAGEELLLGHVRVARAGSPDHVINMCLEYSDRCCKVNVPGQESGKLIMFRLYYANMHDSVLIGL